MSKELDNPNFPPLRDLAQTTTWWPQRQKYKQFVNNPISTISQIQCCPDRAVVLEVGGKDIVALVSMESLRWAIEEHWELDQWRNKYDELTYLFAEPETWGDVLRDWRSWPHRVRNFFLGTPPLENPIPVVPSEGIAPPGWTWR